MTAVKFRKVSRGLMVNPFNSSGKAGVGQFTVYQNYWWIVTDEDDCLLFFSRRNRRADYASPQCNGVETIARALAKREGMYPWPVHVEQIPAVFVPLDISDYLDH